jgi:hypothetical protein
MTVEQAATATYALYQETEHMPGILAHAIRQSCLSLLSLIRQRTGRLDVGRYVTDREPPCSCAVCRDAHLIPTILVTSWVNDGTLERDNPG